MTEIIDFEEARRERGRKTIVLALDDPLYDGPAALETLPTNVNGFQVRYMRVRDVPPGVVPDAQLIRYEPSAPGREPLFHTQDGVVYEQDDAGIIYRAGAAVWPSEPVAFGAPRSGAPGELVLGEEAALLFCRQTQDGLRLRLRVTSPLVRIVRTPRVTRPDFPPAWLEVAAGLLEPPAESDRG